MDGAAGPSGMDASSWKKACSSFAGESEDLCESIACVARKLCTCYVDPNSIDALVAGRLIALDKNPGVRPIGVGEVCRRLIGKAILSVIRSDVLRLSYMLLAIFIMKLGMMMVYYLLMRQMLLTH